LFLYLELLGERAAMFREYLWLVFVASLVYAANASPVFAQSSAEKGAQLAEKVKDGILRLGDGPEAFVRVKLHDKTIAGGYIDEAGADSFTVIDELTGNAVTVRYSQVKQVMGVNSRTRVSIAIGVGRLSRLALRDCWTRHKPSTILRF
jgi:hypothetical protein